LSVTTKEEEEMKDRITIMLVEQYFSVIGKIMCLPLLFIPNYNGYFDTELSLCPCHLFFITIGIFGTKLWIYPSIYKILILYFKIETQIKLIVELIFLIGLGLN
jgi:hypothetical protein